MQDVFPIICIAVILILIVALMLYVQKQKKNHTQLFIYMYGSILDGRLHNLIIELYNWQEWLINTDIQRYKWDNTLQISQETPCNQERFDNLLELAERNGLGNQEKKRLQQGFNYLNQVFTSLDYSKTGTVCITAIPHNEQQTLQKKLAKAIDCFNAVRSQIVMS